MASVEQAEIQSLLPHRYPFLLVDRVKEFEPQKRIIAYKNVTINEPFFQGHFPGRPVMPGVLIIEAMAQTAGALVMNALGQNADGKIVYFMTVDKGRFRRPVGPGDVLEIPVKLMRSRGQVFRFSGEAFVDGKLCAEAEYSAMIVDGGAKESATGN